MANEEIEVELKAKAGNLQQTLEKVQKTLDKLSNGKNEIKDPSCKSNNYSQEDH